MAKFYITGLYHTPTLNDSTLPAIEVEAEDELDAVCKIGLSIWEESHFIKMRSDKTQSWSKIQPIKPDGSDSDYKI